MVLLNSSEVVRVITSFFMNSFKEIDQRGFDLNSLEAVRAVLSKSHINAL